MVRYRTLAIVAIALLLGLSLATGVVEKGEMLDGLPALSFLTGDEGQSTISPAITTSTGVVPQGHLGSFPDPSSPPWAVNSQSAFPGIDSSDGAAAGPSSLLDGENSDGAFSGLSSPPGSGSSSSASSALSSPPAIATNSSDGNSDGSSNPSAPDAPSGSTGDSSSGQGAVTGPPIVGGSQQGPPCLGVMRQGSVVYVVFQERAQGQARGLDQRCQAFSDEPNGGSDQGSGPPPGVPGLPSATPGKGPAPGAGPPPGGDQGNGTAKGR